MRWVRSTGSASPHHARQIALYPVHSVTETCGDVLAKLLGELRLVAPRFPHEADAAPALRFADVQLRRLALARRGGRRNDCHAQAYGDQAPQRRDLFAFEGDLRREPRLCAKLIGQRAKTVTLAQTDERIAP